MKNLNRKESILATAAKLFSEKGFTAVSMRDLAEELGIKAASLYNHISSKQEILSLNIIYLAEQFTSGMNTIASSKINSIEKLNKLIELHVDITLKNIHLLSSMNNDWMHLEEPELSYFLDMRNGYENNFRKIIKKGIRNKELVSLNPEVILFSILSTLRNLYAWNSEKHIDDSEKLAEEMKNILLNGITK
jgi:AcrR family transcriptional regulator